MDQHDTTERPVRSIGSGPLHDLLIGLYAHGPRVIVQTTKAARAEWRVARRALRLGCVSLVGDEPLPRYILDGGLRSVLLTAAGRGWLGIPDPAPLGGRDPIDVLKAGVRLFMGVKAFNLTACEDGSAARRMIARAHYHTVDGWPDSLDAIARFATEQGASCECLYEHDGGDGSTLLGFQRPTCGSEP